MSKGPNDRSGVFFEGGFNVFGGDDTFWNNITDNSISALRFERSGATIFDILNFGELELTSVTGATGPALKVSALTAQTTSTTSGVGALALWDSETNDLLMTVNKVTSGSGWATEFRMRDSGGASNDDVALRLTHDIRAPAAPPQNADLMSMGYSTDAAAYIELFRFKQSGEFHLVKDTGADILWASDGGGDIGASGANRPGSIYADTRVDGGGTEISENYVKIGPQSGITDKTITALQTGSNDPYIKYVNGSSKWQFSNDGTTPLDFGTSNVSSWDDLYDLDQSLTIDGSTLTWTQSATTGVGFLVRKTVAGANDAVMRVETTSYSFPATEPVMEITRPAQDDGIGLRLGGNLVFDHATLPWTRYITNNARLYIQQTAANNGLYIQNTSTNNASLSITQSAANSNLSITAAGILNITSQNTNPVNITAGGDIDLTCTDTLDIDAGNAGTWAMGPANWRVTHTGNLNYGHQVVLNGAGNLAYDSNDGNHIRVSAGHFTVETESASKNLYLISAQDLYFAGRSSGNIPFNESGQTVLSGYTATSIIGALNEVRGGAYETLDDAYNNDAGAAAIAVDAGSVTWNLDDAYSFNVNNTTITAGNSAIVTSQTSTGTSADVYAHRSFVTGNSGDTGNPDYTGYAAEFFLNSSPTAGNIYGFYANENWGRGFYSKSPVETFISGVTSYTTADTADITAGASAFGGQSYIGYSTTLASNASEVNSPTFFGFRAQYTDGGGTVGTTYGFYADADWDFGVYAQSPIVVQRTGVPITGGFTAFISDLDSAGMGGDTLSGFAVQMDSDAADTGNHRAFSASQIGDVSGVAQAYGFYADGNWEHGLYSQSRVYITQSVTGQATGHALEVYRAMNETFTDSSIVKFSNAATTDDQPVLEVSQVSGGTNANTAITALLTMQSTVVGSHKVYNANFATNASDTSSVFYINYNAAGDSTPVGSGISAAFLADQYHTYGLVSYAKGLFDISNITGALDVLRVHGSSGGLGASGNTLAGIDVELTEDAADNDTIVGVNLKLVPDASADNTKYGINIDGDWDAGIYTASPINAPVPIDYNAAGPSGNQEAIYVGPDSTSQSGQAYGIHLVHTNSAGASPFDGIYLDGDSASNPTTAVNINADWGTGVLSAAKRNRFYYTPSASPASAFELNQFAYTSPAAGTTVAHAVMEVELTSDSDDTKAGTGISVITNAVYGSEPKTGVYVDPDWSFGLYSDSPVYIHNSYTSGAGEEYVARFVPTPASAGGAASDRDWTIMVHVENDGDDNGSNRYAALRITGTDNPATGIGSPASIHGIYFPSTDASATGTWPIDQSFLTAEAGTYYAYNDFGSVAGATHHEIYTSATISSASELNCLKITAAPGTDVDGSSWNGIRAQVTNENYKNAWALHAIGGSNAWSAGVFVEDTVGVHADVDLSLIPTSVAIDPTTAGIFNSATSNTVNITAGQGWYAGLKVYHTGKAGDTGGSIYGAHVDGDGLHGGSSLIGYWAGSGCDSGFFANGIGDNSFVAGNGQFFASVSADTYAPGNGTFRSSVTAQAAGAPAGFHEWGYKADYVRDSSDSSSADVYLYTAGMDSTAYGTGSAEVFGAFFQNTLDYGVYSKAARNVFVIGSSEATSHAGSLVDIVDSNPSRTLASLYIQNSNNTASGKCIQINHAYAGTGEGTRCHIVLAGTKSNNRVIPLASGYPDTYNNSIWVLRSGTTLSNTVDIWQQSVLNYDNWLNFPLYLPHRCTLTNISMYMQGWNSGTGTNLPCFELWRHGYGSSTSAGRVSGTVATRYLASGGVMQQASNDYSHTIENHLYAYHIRVRDGIAGSGGNQYLASIRVTYTIQDLTAGQGW